MDLQGFGWQLGVGLLLTVQVALASVVVGLLLGMLGSAAKLSASKWARRVANAYTTVVRGIPELILLLILYYGGTMLVQRISQAFGREEYVEINAFMAGVLTLGFVFGAYATEVFRGAILAIHVGQIEAARAVGMNRWLVFCRIMLPQNW